MFFNEYYFGVPTLRMIFRMIGGPLILYVGLYMYTKSAGRFGIGYGGMMIAFSIYYTFTPLWWIMIYWKNYKTIECELEATPERLIIKEGLSNSQTDYSKFEGIYKRKSYFAIKIGNGTKIYLPFDKLSKETFDMLSSKVHVTGREEQPTLR